MGLLGRMLGTMYPDSDVVPLSAAEVREALLAVDTPDVPYRVRKANPAEKADLVGEWLIDTTYFDERMKLRLRIRMHLDPSEREVRTLQEQWTTTRGNMSASRGYSRGIGFTTQRQWAYERGPDGRRQRVETNRLDTRDMRNALRQAALDAGWAWRGLLRL